MECLVDLGSRIIDRVRGVTPRDCAQLALLEVGAEAKFPIEVIDRATGDRYFLFLVPAEIVGKANA